MSFAGHVFDMIRRSEANRAALVKASRDKAAWVADALYRTPADSRPTAEKPIVPDRLAGELRHIRMRAHDKRRRLAIAGGIL